MKQDNDKTEKPVVSEEFERQVFRTLVEKGHIIPETESEARAAEERMNAEGDDLTAELPDARTILDRIKNRTKAGREKVVPIAQNQFANTCEELARAARKGAEISSEMEAKLRRNRAKAEGDPVTPIAQPHGPTRTDRAKLFPDREAELSDLAAAVVETHSADGRIDPEKIICAKNIALDYDNYEDAFDGMIECANGRFYIHCNLDRENLPGSARARFTLAHELGHYFIDEHRNNLASGQVRPHPSFSDKCTSDLLVEREADFFASRLLLPDSRFHLATKRCRAGLAGINSIAATFEVSLTCAAIRFVTAEVWPAVIVKWSSEGYAWKWCSKQFWSIGYRKTVESIASLPEDSATARCLRSKGAERQIVETGTTASAWFPSTPARGIKNLVLREEAVALGRFGVLTLLTLHNGRFPAEVVANREFDVGTW